MQFAGTVVILAAALPHTKVRRTICPFYVEHEILYKADFVRREDYLSITQQQCTMHTYRLSRATLVQSPCQNIYFAKRFNN